MEDEKPKRTISKALGRLSARRAMTAGPGLHHDGGGLYLRVLETMAGDGVTRNRSRNWFYRYKVAGKQHWLGLGIATAKDGDGHVTLAQAREKVAEQRQLRGAGRDPLAERRQAKLSAEIEIAKAITFKAAAEKYISGNEAAWKNEKHRQQWKNTLETFVYPTAGHLPAQAIDTGIVVKVLQQEVAEERGYPAGPLWQARPETASRLRGRIETILDYAKAHHWRSGENPARWKGHLENILPKPSKLKRRRHHPALPYDRAPDFLVGLHGQDGIAPMALEFTILTAARTGEVRFARWREIDAGDKTWTVPPGRMKASREHRVPLTQRAIDILAEVRKLNRNAGADDFVFPGRKRGKPLSDGALERCIDRLNEDAERPWEDRHGDIITVHGFRSTFDDWAADRTNFPREVAEMALAHAIDDKTEAAYRRGDLFEKRRQLMNAWAEWCARPAPAGGNVTAIGAAASAA
jgi:integrase